MRWWWVIVALAVVVAAWLLRFAVFRVRRRHAQQAAVQEVPETAPAPGQSPDVWVIFNPAKLDNMPTLKDHVNQQAARRGYAAPRWVATTPEDPGTGQAVRAVAAGASLVIAAGGDGTVRAVAAGLAHRGVRMGIVPMGTGNLLARNLHIPMHAQRAAEVAFGLTEILLDIAWLRVEDPQFQANLTAEGALVLAADSQGETGLIRGDEFCYVVIAGLGFDGVTMANTDPDLKKRVGWIAYVLAALKALNIRRMKATLQVRGVVAWGAARKNTSAVGVQASTVRAKTILFANCGELPYLLLAPDAKVDDGLLDVIAVDVRGGLVGWADLASQVLGQGTGIPAARRLRTGHLVFRQGVGAAVKVSSPQVVQVDGDALGEARMVETRVDHAAVAVAVPATWPPGLR